jgi:hypothetical protein
MFKLTRKQKEALKDVWNRDWLKPSSYLAFRRTVEYTVFMDNAIVVPYCGMFLAIETDGYTHS